jgi:hypothetical protein
MLASISKGDKSHSYRGNDMNETSQPFSIIDSAKRLAFL